MSTEKSPAARRATNQRVTRQMSRSRKRTFLGWGAGGEPSGELPGVDLGVVAVAVVEHHVGLGGVLGQALDVPCPGCQLFVAVAVAEPLLDILALPLVRVAMHADDGQVAGGGEDRRDGGRGTLRHVHADV